MTVTLDVAFLPPTSQNLASLQAAIPPGFTQDQALLTPKTDQTQAGPSPSPSTS